MALPEKPFSRKEQYLSKIAGQDTEIPEEPFSREEMYLDEIAKNGGGGGTSDFDQLSNRPSYNGVAMTGTTNIPEVQSYSDFVGTNGQTAGVHGLVPAPATTDAGKYLKADGTWGQVDAGAVVTLTQADYNYPADNPTSVALWLLPPGLYKRGGNDVQVNISNIYQLSGHDIAMVGIPGSFGVPILVFTGGLDSTGYYFGDVYWVLSPSGSLMSNFGLYKTVDNLTSNSDSAPLSAKQGKVLNQKIATDLSTFTLNYPENNPDGLAVWTLPDGHYTFKTNDTNINLKMYWNRDGLYGAPMSNECFSLILDVLHYDEDYSMVSWRAYGQVNSQHFDGGFGTLEGETLTDGGNNGLFISTQQSITL